MACARQTGASRHRITLVRHAIRSGSARLTDLTCVNFRHGAVNLTIEHHRDLC
jgi:hypothetical protein